MRKTHVAMAVALGLFVAGSVVGVPMGSAQTAPSCANQPSLKLTLDASSGISVELSGTQTMVRLMHVASSRVFVAPNPVCTTPAGNVDVYADAGDVAGLLRTCAQLAATAPPSGKHFYMVAGPSGDASMVAVRVPSAKILKCGYE